MFAVLQGWSVIFRRMEVKGRRYAQLLLFEHRGIRTEAGNSEGAGCA